MSANDPKYAGLSSRTWKTSGTVTEGLAAVLHTTERTTKAALTTSNNSLCVGVYLDSGDGGQAIPYALPLQIVPMKSDGSSTISAGSKVALSGTSAGRVKQVTATTAGIGIAVSDCAATLDATVDVFFMGGALGGGGASASTLAAVYAAGTTSTDQTITIATPLGGPIEIFASAGAANGELFSMYTGLAEQLFFICDNASQVITSKAAAGAANRGTVIDTINAVAPLSIKVGGVEKAYFDSAGQFLINNGLAIGNPTQSAYIYTGSGLWKVKGTFSPESDGSYTLGTQSGRWGELWAILHGSKLGAVLSSTGVNSTIAPICGVHHVSGVGSIQNITPPVAGFVGAITLWPDAVFTLVATGNIAKASTAVVGQPMEIVFDGTGNCAPSY